VQITILYDGDEERVREAALARGEKFPRLVCTQVEEALAKRGHGVKLLAAEPPITRLVRQLEDDSSDLIFNICESLGGNGAEEKRIASLLELLDKRFTGSGSLALTLAGDKSLSKKLFDFHRVCSPEFIVITAEHIEGKPQVEHFPMIVKPIASDASIGINARSIVHDVDEMLDRVHAVHRDFHTPALVEQYIDGRELYVALLGDTLLPPIEWDLSELPDGLPRIAGTEAKWEVESAPEFIPDDIMGDAALLARIHGAALAACNATLIRDYARVDLRLDAGGTPYVIEVNPNPWLDANAEFAMAAKNANPSIDYDDMIERIVTLAMNRWSGS
jgi:D-alanine-D-alanine ligase